jgi:hypothetical protein
MVPRTTVWFLPNGYVGAAQIAPKLEEAMISCAG